MIGCANEHPTRLPVAASATSAHVPSKTSIGGSISLLKASAVFAKPRCAFLFEVVKPYCRSYTNDLLKDAREVTLVRKSRQICNFGQRT